MSDPLLGEIKMFGGNFAPRGWALCQGQLLPIAQNTALFSILGTTYGGNGTQTFALPDLRGRVAIGYGQGPGLSPVSEGEMGGVETVTLSTNQMPAHTHPFSVDSDVSNVTGTAAGNYLMGKTESGESISSTLQPLTTLNANAVGVVGGNQAHENRPPWLSVGFIIALQGIFPSRN